MNLSFFKDKEFIGKMLSLAIPVAFQQFISAGLNMVDVLMVGQLGETSIAALGLANQVFFLLIVFLFGVTSGMAIFTAQFWGKRDTESIHKVMGISLTIVTLVGALFTLGEPFFPKRFCTSIPQTVK